MEQARWNQANIDSLFYAGSQDFVNKYYNFSPGYSGQKFHFNLIQQPVNMVTGYQRQHRRSINYLPTEGSDPDTCDQYTRLINNASKKAGINEVFSKACELATISGMVLLQPYLDFTGEDPAQGDLKLKLWEYSSFLCDPYFREPDMSDANYVWCQEYISKTEAKNRFPTFVDDISTMSTNYNQNSNFYFLPEQNFSIKNNLLVLSYVWYKTIRKKKMLYSRSQHQFYDYIGNEQELLPILQTIPDLEEVSIDVSTWRQVIVLNQKMLWEGENPLKTDECPFIPVYWNYEPHINQPDLRCRSLVRTMRDTQYLLNRRIILNHDISESTINSGWKRKSGAVANEENLKKTGQGWDLIVNEGYELSDVEKIIPSAVPESDMRLADQLQNMIFATSGVNIENWSAQEDKQVSSLTVLLKQGANLMVLQKYFDQWDLALQTLGKTMLNIVCRNWNPIKVQLMIGEEPTPFFFNKIFVKYSVMIAEGLDTATQRQEEFKQTIELNEILGGMIPPSYLASIATIQGKTKLMKILQQQEEQQTASQQEAQNIEQTFQEAKLKEMYAKAANLLAMARERHGRSEANVGLFEERLSEITHNRAMALKDKVEALEKLMNVLNQFGEAEAKKASQELESYSINQSIEEDREKADSKQTSLSNEFVQSILQEAIPPPQDQLQNSEKSDNQTS